MAEKAAVLSWDDMLARMAGMARRERVERARSRFVRAVRDMERASREGADPRWVEALTEKADALRGQWEDLVLAAG